MAQQTCKICGGSYNDKCTDGSAYPHGCPAISEPEAKALGKPELAGTDRPGSIKPAAHGPVEVIAL